MEGIDDKRYPCTNSGILASEPCVTCYAEDCLARRKCGKNELSKRDYAADHPAPYICDVGGHSVCEGHMMLAVIAGWKPRRKDELFA